jgi:hypothetical protein
MRGKPRAKTVLKLRDVPFSEIAAHSKAHAAGATARTAEAWERFRGKSIQIFLDPILKPDRSRCESFTWECVPEGETYRAAVETFGGRVFTVCSHIAEAD